jgi:hypothetical protein
LKEMTIQFQQYAFSAQVSSKIILTPEAQQMMEADRAALEHQLYSTKKDEEESKKGISISKSKALGLSSIPLLGPSLAEGSVLFDVAKGVVSSMLPEAQQVDDDE